MACSPPTLNTYLQLLLLGLTTPAGARECPPQHVAPPEPWWRANFGGAVAMSGSHMAIADHSDAAPCGGALCAAGAVHLYRFDEAGARWTLRQTIRPHDIDEFYSFGRSVAFSEERLVVGSPSSDLAGPETGAAYVFDYDGERWVETGQISPVEPIYLSGFGRYVAVQRGVAVVGQPKHDLAWYYEEGPSGWEMRQKLVPPDDPPINSEFGNAVAITDGWVFIGAHFDKSLGIHSGGVYVYRREPGGELTFTQKLLAPDPGGVPEFGHAIAVDGDRLAVGAPRSTRTVEAQGVIHIFELSGGRWEWRQELTHVRARELDFLGDAVTLRGDTLVVGLPRARLGAGSAYVFTPDASGVWRQRAHLFPPIAGHFGESVATDGRWALVGSPDETVVGVEITGAAYIFDLACILCRVDLDGDGELTFFDFLAFQNLFAAGDLRADFDGDGELTFFDFLAFQNEFAAGCA